MPLVLLESAFQCYSMKRESGASPEQSRCCKLIYKVNQTPYATTVKTVGRRFTGVSQKTCKTFKFPNPRGRTWKKTNDVINHFMIKSKCFRHIRLQLCMCCFVMCAPHGLQAQQTNDSITGKVHAIPDIVVKGRRTPQRITVAMPTQVLDKKELESLGFQNLADAIRRFAGTNVKDYGGIGGLKTVSVRSLGATHTAVAYDGVVVSNTQAGQIDIGRFSLDDIEMIALSVGQSNNLLQSARLFASAGTLSIYGKNILDETSNPYAFKGYIKTGSFGYINPSIKWAQRINQRTSYNLDGNFLRADGSYPFTLINGKYQTKEKRRNSDIISWHNEFNLNHTLKDSSDISIKAYYFNSERGLPGSVIFYNDQSNERLWDKNFFTQVQYKKFVSTDWAFQIQAKYNYSWNKYEDTDVKYEGGKETDINKQLEYYLSETTLWNPFKGFSTSFANDFAINTLDSNLPDSPLPTRYSWLAALNVNYQWKNFVATSTFVHTLMIEDVKYGERPNNRHRLSPTLSLSYRPWMTQSLYLRLMYKDTFRVPTFNDLYYRRLGNTKLESEKAHEYNLGVTWSGRPFTFVDNITFTSDVYYNKIDNKIVAIPTTYVWKMMNFGKVRITGVDITVQTSIPIKKDIHLLLSSNYTYQKAIDITDSSEKNYKDQIPYTPIHSGNLTLLCETPWINVSYLVTGVSKRFSLPQNLYENQINGYIEQTLSISRTFKLGRCRLRLQAELANLTNKQYDIIKYYPMPGRSFHTIGSIEF